MSIPKGLIFYKATRHKENFPVDIKYGCYSAEISSALHATSKNKPYANFHRRYQKKLVQEISFNFFDDIPKEKGALRAFSSFSGIKKCTIDSAIFSLPHHSKKLMLKILQKLFRSFKRIKQLKLGSLGPLNSDSKTFKNLLLLNQLESLVLLNFEYKADSKNLQLLLKVAQKASKRRSWLNFKSFRVLPFCSGVSFASSAVEIVQALQNLFEFIQGLKLCENIYNSSSFQITLPNCSLVNSKQAEILSKISRISPSLTRIKVHQLKHFSNFFKMCQNSRDLKAISFRIASDRKEQNIDLSFLEKITTLEELELRLENKGGGLFQHILPQIQRLTDLTVLSLDFCGKLGELKYGLVQVISGLSELKDLKLKFTENVEKTDPNNVQFSLEDIFGAVSVKRKLEKLYLYFWDFGFDNSSQTFEVMCQSLEKLTSLTNFDLEIMKGSTIEKKEILLFCEVLRKLNRIQYFHLQIEGSLAFKPRIFGMLFDCIAESLPFLSSFGLALSSVEITRESFPTLSNAMKKMKCLNEVRILLGGCAETGVDIDILAGEIKKRAPADIYTYFT